MAIIYNYLSLYTFSLVSYMYIAIQLHVLDSLTFTKAVICKTRTPRVQKGEANQKQQLSELYMQLKTLISGLGQELASYNLFRGCHAYK